MPYVDNFSWLAPTKGSFVQSLELAQSTCLSLKSPIDWGKSFCWATTPRLKTFLDKHLGPHLPPDGVLRRAADATDLGVHFRFQIRSCHGKEDRRLVEGKRRLDVLRKQPRSLPHKNGLLLAGIWPQACMSSRVLPNSVAGHLRSKAAKALCHTGPSQSSILSQTDPEVYLFVQAIASLRRAFQVQPRLAECVLARLQCIDSADGLVYGPATALAKLFHRHGWTCGQNGWCLGPGMHTFSLKCSSRKQICNAVQFAWVYSLPDKVAHRNGLAQLGALSLSGTHSVLNALPSQVRGVFNCVAGGYMSNSDLPALWSR